MEDNQNYNDSEKRKLKDELDIDYPSARVQNNVDENVNELISNNNSGLLINKSQNPMKTNSNLKIIVKDEQNYEKQYQNGNKTLQQNCNNQNNNINNKSNLRQPSSPSILKKKQEYSFAQQENKYNSSQADLQGDNKNKAYFQKNNIVNSSNGNVNVQKSQLGMENSYDKKKIKKFQEHFENAKLQGKMDKLKTFMLSIVNDLESRRYKRINDNHLKTLNDKAIFIKNVIIRKNISQYIECCWDSIDNCLGSMCGSKPFHPFSLWIFWMYIIESITIIACLFFYTLFCFFDYFIPDFFFYLGIYSISIFAINCILRLNTAYFDQGKIISDRNMIIKRYRNDLFFYDFIGFIGMTYQIYINDNDQLTKQLVFLLIFKYKIYLFNMEKIEERLNLSGTAVYIWQLLKFLCSSLSLCHFIGTAYFFLAFIQSYYLNEKNTWVDKLDYWDKPAHAQYVEAYYWALATITLIGTKGQTELETIFCICVLIITIGVFATILSQVAMVCEEMEKKQKNYKKDRDALNTFFEVHAINSDLQGQLQNYLKYSYEGHKEKMINSEFATLMNDKFPLHLQETVRKERYTKDIQKFSLLSKNFSEYTLQSVINIVQEEYYMPNQNIIKRNVQQESFLYLILAGETVVYQETGDQQSVIVTLKPGQFFGQDTFFTDSTPFYCVKSNTNAFTTVLTINRQQFLDIISKPGNEVDKQKFQEIKDEMSFKPFANLIKTQCYICGQLHDESQCNLINYKANKLGLIYRYNHSDKQERNDDFSRIRSIGKFNAKLYQYILADREYSILQNADLRKYIKVIQEHQRALDEKNQSQSNFSFSSSDDDEYDDDDDDSFRDQNSLQRPSMNKITSNNMFDNFEEQSHITEENSGSDHNIQKKRPSISLKVDQQQPNNSNLLGYKGVQQSYIVQSPQLQYTNSLETENNKTPLTNNKEYIRLDTEDQFQFDEIQEYMPKDSCNRNKKDMIKNNVNHIPFARHNQNIQNKQYNNNNFSNEFENSQVKKHLQGSVYNRTQNKKQSYTDHQNLYPSSRILGGNGTIIQSSGKIKKQKTKNQMGKTISMQSYKSQVSGANNPNSLNFKNKNKYEMQNPNLINQIQRKNSIIPGRKNSLLMVLGQQGGGLRKKSNMGIIPPFMQQDQSQMLVLQALGEINTQNVAFQQQVLDFIAGDQKTNAKLLDDKEFFYDFDIMQLFEDYLIHNNFDRVIPHYNQCALQILKRKQKLKHKTSNKFKKKVGKINMLNALKQNFGSKLQTQENQSTARSDLNN